MLSDNPWHTMAELNKHKRFFLVTVVFVLIFILHLSYLFYIELPDRSLKNEGVVFHGIKLFGDEGDYVKIGYNIYHNSVFGYSKGSLTAHRPPLWPFVLSIVFRFTDNILYLMMLNHFIFSLVSVFAYVFSSIFFSTRASLLTMIIVGLNPNTYSYVRLYTEPLFALLLIILIIFFTLTVTTDKLLNPIFCGIFAGLLSLTRAEGLLIILFFSLYFFFCYLTSKLKIMAAMLFIGFAAMTVAPWMIRNYAVLGHLGISINSGEVFAGAHNKKILLSDYGRWINFNDFATPEEQRHRERLSEAEGNRYLWQLGFDNLKDYSVLFILKLELKKLLLTFLPYFILLPPEYPHIINIISGLPYNILWLLFIVLSFKWLYYAEKWRVFLIPFLVPLVVTLVFYGFARFRVPYESIAFSLTIGCLDS